MNQPQLLSQTHPGGCYLGFNAGIDRKPAEQIIFLCSDACKNGYKEINLLLTSSGGMLDHAYYICSMLEALPAKIITYNVGNLASSANLVFLAGDERYSVKNATFFFHQTHYPPPLDAVTAKLVKARSEGIAREDARSCDYIAQRTGASAKNVARWHRNELVMDTAGALANGIIVGVKAPIIPPDAFFHQIII